MGHDTVEFDQTLVPYTHNRISTNVFPYSNRSSQYSPITLWLQRVLRNYDSRITTMLTVRNEYLMEIVECIFYFWTNKGHISDR